MSSVCAVDACLRTDIQARGWCRMHYFRWYRTGSIDGIRQKRPSRGVCTVDGCDMTDAGSHGMCQKHRTRVARHGDPHVVNRPRVRRGAENSAWSGDDVTYGGMHLRVRKAKGRASSFKCPACEAKAAHWAYDHTDPNEKKAPEGPYSIDLARYQPMCVRCHKALDMGVIRAQQEAVREGEGA